MDVAGDHFVNAALFRGLVPVLKDEAFFIGSRQDIGLIGPFDGSRANTCAAYFAFNHGA